MRRIRYGAEHRRVRAKVAEEVATGRVLCARCGELIHPGEPFDLDHRDDKPGYLGPSHVGCNRGAPKRAGE